MAQKSYEVETQTGNAENADTDARIYISSSWAERG